MGSKRRRLWGLLRGHERVARAGSRNIAWLEPDALRVAERMRVLRSAARTFREDLEG